MNELIYRKGLVQCLVHNKHDVTIDHHDDCSSDSDRDMKGAVTVDTVTATGRPCYPVEMTVS